MFGKLKEKLKSWITKNEETPEKEILEETPKEKSLIKKEKPNKKTKTRKGEVKGKSRGKTKTKIQPIEEEPKEKKSFFSIFKKEKSEEKQQVSKTKSLQETNKENELPINKPEEKKKLGLFQKALTEEKFEELFSELQIILLQHNVAYEAVEAIETHLKKSLIGESTKEVNIIKELKTAIENLLINPPNFLEEIKNSKSKPFVILFAGINGSGKTTTIAKVAHYLQKNKMSVCLIAADTFRAAAIQQLEEHGKNLKIPVIKKDYGSDPAAVGFDGVKYAQKNKIDVVLIDTAGRMQNKDSLMKEIEKISRVTKPDMKIFLGESTTGNDATLQAKAFNDSIGLTGIILSKADVDESGGTAISVAHVSKVPILFLGTGQKYEDLEIFDKEKLIEKLGL
ncbi:signal recognition particle-docking protein FtsY [Candidatus Pacearchaeota archaeon]|nr:signal recognition particle-docking protein FtsY [Candidatus Pacearchaeota archaeon]